jgi:hypothetical protein
MAVLWLFSSCKDFGSALALFFLYCYGSAKDFGKVPEAFFSSCIVMAVLWLFSSKEQEQDSNSL